MFRKPTAADAPGPDASISDAAPCQKSLRLRVGRDLIMPVRSTVLAEFQRQAALPGFRKGKAPAGLVERQYAKDIQDETLHRVTRQAFEQVAERHQLKPVGPFEVRTMQFSEADGLTLEATVEVEPSFALGRYKGIPLARAPVGVSPQDLERAMSSLQESMAQLVPAKTGEGKERQVPPLDEELAKDLGYPSVAALKEHVAAKLLEQQRAAQAQGLETALCDELVARHPFEVPPRLVAHQTERLTRDFKVRLLLSGVPEEELDGRVTQFAGELRTSAARHVKLGFILERIAAQESVTVAQDELVKRLWQLAQRWKKDPAQVRQVFDAQGLWPSVVSAIRQEKTIALLLSAAKVEGTGPPGPVPSIGGTHE